MALSRNRAVKDVLVLTLSLVSGCAGGYSAVTKVGDRDVSARSATANMMYVRSGEQTATFDIDTFKFSVDRTHVSWDQISNSCVATELEACRVYR
jgi:hypothetical protein